MDHPLSDISLELPDGREPGKKYLWPKQAFTYDQRYSMDIGRDDATKAKVNDNTAGEPVGLFETWAEINGGSLTTLGGWAITDIVVSGNKVEKFTVSHGSGGSGMGEGPAFTLTADGLLQTARVLDHEEASRHELGIRATGANGESLEKIFEVKVGDEFRPIVRTVELPNVTLSSHLWGFSNNTQLKQDQDIGYLYVAGENGEPVDEQYFFEALSSNGIFSVSPEGMLFVNTPLNLQQNNQWSLRVGYSSDGERKEAYVRLIVTGDLSDPLQIVMGKPVVTLSSHLWGFSNNTQLKQGQDIGYLYVAGENGEPVEKQYFFEALSSNGIFSVSPEGMLFVNTPLNLQQNNQWSLRVGYSSDGERKEAYVRLMVTGDLSDPLQIVMGKPVVTLSSHLWGFSNNTQLKQGQDIGYIYVAGENGEPVEEQYVFEVLSSNDIFSVSPEGMLFVNTPLNLQQKNQWSLRVGYSSDGEKGEGIVDLIVTGNQGDPLQIYIENLDAEEAVKFLIRGREYSDMLEPKTIERGFVVASYPDPEISDKDAQVIVVSGTGDEFEHSLTLTGQSGKIYYRAYALNAEGVTYGSTSYIEMDEKEVSPRWADASSLDGTEGWWSSPWLGEFYRVDDSGWLMHAELGWLFTMGDDTAGVWLWQERLGWVWTRSDLYPFLYRNDTGSWVFLHGKGSGDRLLLYDYQSNYWTTLGTP